MKIEKTKEEITITIRDTTIYVSREDIEIEVDWDYGYGGRGCERITVETKILYDIIREMLYERQ